MRKYLDSKDLKSNFKPKNITTFRLLEKKKIIPSFPNSLGTSAISTHSRDVSRVIERKAARTHKLTFTENSSSLLTSALPVRRYIFLSSSSSSQRSFRLNLNRLRSISPRHERSVMVFPRPVVAAAASAVVSSSSSSSSLYKRWTIELVRRCSRGAARGTFPSGICVLRGRFCGEEESEGFFFGCVVEAENNRRNNLSD